MLIYLGKKKIPPYHVEFHDTKGSPRKGALSFNLPHENNWGMKNKPPSERGWQMLIQMHSSAISINIQPFENIMAKKKKVP